MTPEPTPAQLNTIWRWLTTPDSRTVDELRADLRAMGDGVHPRQPRQWRWYDRVLAGPVCDEPPDGAR